MSMKGLWVVVEAGAVEVVEDVVVVAVVVGEAAADEECLEGGDTDVYVAPKRLANTSEWKHTHVQVFTRANPSY